MVGLCAFTPGAWVQSLVWELRSHTLRGMAKKGKQNFFLNIDFRNTKSNVTEKYEKNINKINVLKKYCKFQTRLKMKKQKDLYMKYHPYPSQASLQNHLWPSTERCLRPRIHTGDLTETSPAKDSLSTHPSCRISSRNQA